MVKINAYSLDQGLTKLAKSNKDMNVVNLGLIMGVNPQSIYAAKDDRPKELMPVFKRHKFAFRKTGKAAVKGFKKKESNTKNLIKTIINLVNKGYAPKMIEKLIKDNVI